MAPSQLCCRPRPAAVVVVLVPGPVTFRHFDIFARVCGAVTPGITTVGELDSHARCGVPHPHGHCIAHVVSSFDRVVSPCR